MQLPTVAVAFLLFTVACDAVKLRSQSAEVAAERTWLAKESRTIAEAEADDHRFWTAAFAAQEAELTMLQEAADENASVHYVAKGNSSSAPAAKAPAAKEAPAAKAPATTAATNTSVTPAKAHEHRRSPLAGVKLNLNPKSAADLIPALAMLKAMYEDGKDRISKLNAREKSLKSKFEDKKKVHEERVNTIEARFKNHTLSAEFHTNETRDELRMWKYWEGCRERQHKQFHTSLKIQHGTMSKVKTMIDMYEKTISGKADKQAIKKELGVASGGGMPEIVFFQTAWRETAMYCHGALAELRTAKAEFQRGNVEEK